MIPSADRGRVANIQPEREESFCGRQHVVGERGCLRSGAMFYSGPYASGSVKFMVNNFLGKIFVYYLLN